jgi:diguanylate cyclase (GGDEF)-like protein
MAEAKSRTGVMTSHLADAGLSGDGCALAMAERFACAFEYMSHGMCMFDADERLVICNEKYRRMFGLDQERIPPGTTLHDILAYSTEIGVASQTVDELYAIRKAAIMRREPADYREPLSDGRTIAICHRPLPDGGWVGIYEDVTARLAADASLVTQNRRFEAALSNMSQGLVMYDEHGRLVVRNASYLDMYGLTPEEQPIGATRRQILDVFLAKKIYKTLDINQSVQDHARLVGSGQSYAQVKELADGRTIHILHRPIVGGGFVATFDDITASRAAEENVRFLAHHDALTGLANRIRFGEALRGALERTREHGVPAALLSIDLDRFKAVNDTMGHPAGDTLLRVTAERLASLAEPGRHHVARIGGDEFAVLLEAADRAGAEHWARCAAKKLQKPVLLESGHSVSVGCSIGIALAPDNGADEDGLLKCADLALYRAKGDGRGTFQVYEDTMAEPLRHRSETEIALRSALRSGELTLHYQPLVDAWSGLIVGFEPLMRWRRADGSVVPPSEFIPLAEETGSILPIGEWALEQACLEALKWPDDLYVAVNVSAVQLRRPNFAHRVARILERTGLAPRRLEIEITESMLMEETPAARRSIDRLKQMGVLVALDDFGTGYSSLSYLRHFPFDRIKIDRSFVSEIDNDDTAAIVATIVALARRLGMAITAEGIETEDQLELCRTAGCATVQGYLFSPALPPERIPALLARFHPAQAAMAG